MYYASFHTGSRVPAVAMVPVVPGVCCCRLPAVAVHLEVADCLAAVDSVVLACLWRPLLCFVSLVWAALRFGSPNQN
jgi:hypothetical protein